MKKIAILIAALLSLTLMGASAQETPPAGLKPINAQFYIHLPDSTIWQFKGVPYNWHRVGKYSDVSAFIPKIDSVKFIWNASLNGVMPQDAFIYLTTGNAVKIGTEDINSYLGDQSIYFNNTTAGQNSNFGYGGLNFFDGTGDRFSIQADPDTTRISAYHPIKFKTQIQSDHTPTEDNDLLRKKDIAGYLTTAGSGLNQLDGVIKLGGDITESTNLSMVNSSFNLYANSPDFKHTSNFYFSKDNLGLYHSYTIPSGTESYNTEVAARDTAILLTSHAANSESTVGIEIKNGTPGGAAHEAIKVIDTYKHKGIVGEEYFGANADDNTYVQKKYIDSTRLHDSTQVSVTYLPRVNNGIRIKGGSATSATLGQNHLVIKADTAGKAARIHFEPNGYYDGVQSKTDYMGVPFDDSNTGYNLGNLFFKKGDFSGSFGTNGIFFIGAKSSLKEAPIYPSINIGFNDDNTNAVPMKLFYIDHTQTQFYTPMTGMWRTAKAYIIGQYITAGNNVYIAASTGTSGGTEPTHTTGTVSDGGVDWTFVTAYSTSSTNVKPVVIVGNRADMPKFGFASVRMQFAQPTLAWNGIKHNFLNSSGALQYSLGTETDDFFIRNISGVSSMKMLSAGGFLFTGNVANSTLTASQLVASDASKNLVSITALPSGTTATTQAVGTNNTTVGTMAAIFAGDALKANIASPTFTGTVTIPSPFTLGATSVTTTGAKLNFLTGAAGTTGGSTSSLVFSNNPQLITPRLTGYTVATLPAGTIGMMAYVTDALTPVYLGPLTGGGTVVTPVFYNGTAWISY